MLKVNQLMHFVHKHGFDSLVAKNNCYREICAWLRNVNQPLQGVEHVELIHALNDVHFERDLHALGEFVNHFNSVRM